jgi:hypothetical protein
MHENFIGKNAVLRALAKVEIASPALQLNKIDAVQYIVQYRY